VLVQASSGEGSSVTFVPVAFPGVNRADDLIVAFVRFSTTSPAMVSLSDSLGNTYAEAVNQNQDTDGHQVAIWYASAIGAGPNTVTATFTAQNNHPFLAVYEYGGLAMTNPLDATASAQGTGTTASPGQATTTSPNELIFGGVGFPAASTATVTAGPDFTLERTSTGGSHAATEDRNVSASGAYSSDFTLSTSANWSAVMATFH